MTTVVEHECQCCGRTETLPEGERLSPTWDGVWCFPPVHVFTTCPRCPSSHLITGDPCDHEWTMERYEEANRAMEKEFPELLAFAERVEREGLSMEQLKGALEKYILSKETKQ